MFSKKRKGCGAHHWKWQERLRAALRFARVPKASAIWLAAAAMAAGQTPTGRIDLPKDSPVAMVSMDWSGSRAMPRGSAYLVDIHASVSLRNSSQKHIRGVTLAVLAQEVT